MKNFPHGSLEHKQSQFILHSWHLPKVHPPATSRPFYFPCPGCQLHPSKHPQDSAIIVTVFVSSNNNTPNVYRAVQFFKNVLLSLFQVQFLMNKHCQFRTPWCSQQNDSPEESEERNSDGQGCTLDTTEATSTADRAQPHLAFQQTPMDPKSQRYNTQGI